jgi:LDH2 family malate/lactate/ureidoglycolate dehydrogenase
MKVGLKDLQSLTRRLYLKLQYPEAQTETILDVLSYAHRRGNFQSPIQEVAVGTPRFNAQREIVAEKETSISCLIDAGGNIGICALQLAADLLVSKARTSGFALVGILTVRLRARGQRVTTPKELPGTVSLAWSFAAQARWLRRTGAANAPM